MYLTKLELDLSAPGVRAALGDGQKMHRLICGCFGTARKASDIQYRCRPRGAYADLYLYSACPAEETRIPKGMRLAGQRDISPWLEEMAAGDVLQFRLVTVPFRKVAENGAKNSRRRALRTQEERFAWLTRKAEQGGFEVLSVEETPAEKLTARHPAESGGSLTVDAFCYTGTLRIQEAARFRETVRTGIGAEKAYGFGMLMLKGRGT